MESVGIALAVFATFKEVYLLSKITGKIVKSVKNSETEHASLEVEFHFEFLYMRSTGLFFLQHNGVVDDDGLNKAFRDRKKLQKVLRKFQKWNQKLKELVPLALGVNPRFRELSSESLANVISNRDANIIGFGTHAQLRQRIVDPSFETRTLRLEDVTLDTQPASSALSIGTLHSPKPQNGGLKEEQILVEYKYQVATQLPFLNRSNTSLSSSTTSSSLSATTSATSTLTLSQTAETDEQQVRQLASLLSSSGNDELRTLPFRGYIQEKHHDRYAFVFSFPLESDHSDPRSLNDIIEHATSFEKFSLPTRFKVAQMVAKTISAFHADGWVHKSTQSQSIVFFRDRDNPVGPPSYQKPYLMNFEYSRPEDVATLMVQYDSVLGNDLYRHPDRQGPPRSSFRRSHDVYSLGVVLLEIGVWQTAMSIYKEASAQMKKGVYPSPRGIRNIFIDVAKRRIQHHMGPAYLDAVLYCLQGGTGSSMSEGESFSMDFYEKVVQALDVKHLI